MIKEGMNNSFVYSVEEYTEYEGLNDYQLFSNEERAINYARIQAKHRWNKQECIETRHPLKEEGVIYSFQAENDWVRYYIAKKRICH